MDARKGSAEHEGCLYFYSHTAGEHGCFSQFYASDFCDEEGRWYTCAEQYMMAAKARLMGDEATMRRILGTGYDPQKAKRLGRSVSPFDAELWERRRAEVVTHGNFLKFSQNPQMRATLLATAKLTLVEAAPKDAIWGIGISVEDAAAGRRWQGLNLLGQALMRVREALQTETKIPPHGRLREAGKVGQEEGVRECLRWEGGSHQVPPEGSKEGV